MDYLAASGLEPQLAIPVIVVVVGALLVYVFGFQKSEEPSLEHLAVLQSTSSYKARSVSNVKHKNNIVSSKPREKPLQQNGVGGHGHDNKNRGGGDAAQKKKDVSTKENKENKPPTTPKSQTSSKKVKQEVIRPEDFDSGEWIQATSRKDKKKQVKPKDEPKENPAIPSSPKKTESNKQPTQKDNDDAISKTSAEDTTESVLKEAQVQVQSQTTQTTPKATPEKKAGKKGGAKDVSTSTTTTGSSSGSSQESTPVKKQTKPQPQETNKPAAAASETKTSAPEVVPVVNGVAEAPKQEQASSPVKKQSISEDAAPPASSTEPKGHVAFDELGDTTDAWEEAKSRGNKKRRARKD